MCFPHLLIECTCCCLSSYPTSLVMFPWERPSLSGWYSYVPLQYTWMLFFRFGSKGTAVLQNCQAFNWRGMLYMLWTLPATFFFFLQMNKELHFDSLRFFLAKFELSCFSWSNLCAINFSCSVGSFKNFQLHTQVAFFCSTTFSPQDSILIFKRALRQSATATTGRCLNELTTLQIERKHKSLSVLVFSAKLQHQGYESKNS